MVHPIQFPFPHQDTAVAAGDQAAAFQLRQHRQPAARPVVWQTSTSSVMPNQLNQEQKRRSNQICRAPIVSLPGRAGLDLNLTLSYNSLVWTRDGAYIKYNADLGSPAPGFRLDLPNLQQRFYNSQTGIYAYMMVTSSGGRIELRQVTTNSYEAADGSNTQLTATQTRCWCAPQRAHNSPSFQ